MSFAHSNDPSADAAAFNAVAWDALWGKYGDGSNGHHPLACHLIDVLAVAERLWQDVLPARTRAMVAGDLGLPIDAAGRWIAALAGLHDIGKASPAFQLGTLPDPDGSHRTALARVGLTAGQAPIVTRHDLLSAIALSTFLRELGVGRGLAADLGLTVGGHHGAFPSAADVLVVGPLAAGGAVWERARADLARQLFALAEVPPADLPVGRSARTTMVLAGLVSVADWIGSSVECFPYAVPAGLAPDEPVDLTDYAGLARERTDAALDRLGWLALPSDPGGIDFEAMFDFPPRPLQEAAIGLASELTEPGIIAFEVPMGEGKTEAALYLADRWGWTTGSRGAYVALPTQATSDQMFRRVRDALRRRYTGEAIVLQLLHGHASLSAEFEELLRAGDRLFTPTDVDPDARSSDPSVVAATWFTARKRGLLAPYGVGTIDQSLLAALVVRHVFVRLFGLAGRVVILDEVHAYDTYMSTLLERLIEWLGALGSSVILLSATLPLEKRRALLASYARGAGVNPPADDNHSYPAIAWMSPSSAGVVPVAVSEAGHRTLAVRWLAPADDGSLADAVIEALIRLTGGGGCAAVVCNTVERAQATFLRLRDRLPGTASDGHPIVDLLHARYPFDERETREGRALSRFGRGEGTVRPDRAILVSTQVIEQSLDLDFDAMVSDFAPIDLLLQRSGRLHRHRANDHRRPEDLREPVLHIVGPSRVVGGEPIVDRGSAAVYDDPHVRLRTWLALAGRDAIRVPEDVREVIEAVYAEREASPNMPGEIRAAWQRTRDVSRSAAAAEAAEARDRWVRSPLDAGATVSELTRSATTDDPEAGTFQALTRLGADAELVVCLLDGPGGPLLDGHPVDLAAAPTVAQARRLLRRSLRVSLRRLLPVLRSIPVPTGWRRSALLRGARVLTFDEAGTVILADPSGRGSWRLVLDIELGLIIDRSADGGDDD